jgi:sterol desaturase/sphingolipid hydroxylase (fatty acid hydroxylase superfamily)
MSFTSCADPVITAISRCSFPEEVTTGHGWKLLAWILDSVKRAVRKAAGAPQNCFDNRSGILDHTNNSLPVSNESVSIRLFESNFLEFFTYFHYSTPLLIFIPVLSYLAYKGLYIRHTSPVIFLAGTLAGVFLWSLAEYLTHRFLFHAQPGSGKGKRFVFLFHGVHHSYPRDPWRLIMTPFASVPAALASFTLFHWVFSEAYATPVTIGFGLGYLIYDLLHYTIHFNGKRFPFLKRYHLRHHFSDPQRGFGVTSPFWDYVFGTRFQKSLLTKGT